MHVECDCGYCEKFVYILHSSSVCFVNIIFGNRLVLLRYPKPTPKPRFLAKTVHCQNLGFSVIIDSFWAHLHAKII